MPDKDYIHTKISKYYYKLADAYRSDSYQEKVPEAMNVGMKKCLVDYGDDIIRLVSKIEKKIKPANEATPLERQNVPWVSIVRDIEKTIQRDKCPKRVKAMIGECAENMVAKMKQGRIIEEPGHYLVRKFLDQEYESDFKEPFRKKFSKKVGLIGLKRAFPLK